MPTPNKPVQHIRRSSVQAAIWKNAGKDDGAFYTVTIERRYRDKSGEWKTTHAFGRDELLVVAKVADLANSAIHELQQADRVKSPPDGSGNKRQLSQPGHARPVSTAGEGRSRSR